MAEGAVLLYTSPAGPPESMRTLGDALDLRQTASLDGVGAADAPALLLLSDGFAGDDAAIAGLPDHVVILSETEEAGRFAGAASRLFLSLDSVASPDALARLVKAAAQHSAALLGATRSWRQLDDMHTKVRELNRIGVALMGERDSGRLLDLILTQARRLTTSDAGSLYLVEQAGEDEYRLRFRLAQNDTLPDLPIPDFTLPLDDTSVAGYAAMNGEPLILEDAYEISDEEPYSFNRGFDEEVGYRAKSMLVVPMLDHKDRVVGVLQLINRKADVAAEIRNEDDAEAHVLGYGPDEVETVQSLAGQAAVSIENQQLYADIENLFEGFIKAAVIAIDQRDPTTSGHSVRVATLTCDIAEVVDRADHGPFKAVSFSREQMKELRYAGLLHDFGKVGVREEVLVKSKKLPPVLFERIEARFDLIHRTLESEYHQAKAAYLVAHGREGMEEHFARLEEELRASQDKMNMFHQAVREANVPRVLPEEGAEVLQEIARATFTNFEGEQVPMITADELHFLSIAKGSLDPDERKQIESHVRHTYEFLTQIPWTEDLSQVAEIAYGHHEKLNGKGYPRGIGEEELTLQTRMMTVSDIFDALTASDRPYKKALPASRALEILEMEAGHGLVDGEVMAVLAESQVYKRVLEGDWREF